MKMRAQIHAPAIVARAAIVAAIVCLAAAATARPALARADGARRRFLSDPVAAEPLLAMDRLIAAVPSQIDRFTALDPDPALVARAAQLRHALGESQAARGLIDGVLGLRPGFWPAILERSDLRAGWEAGCGGCP
jgi:hypothetical protein